ncbi:hypothetical protein OAL53_03670 [Akkermansiaceae bacterium]|jgi:hypothetical protein|nr:hypothetical protein [Verrucomicrobiota bacterium]MDA7671423.1 hypothetical protein [Akkermansiaceae bacterium]MDB4411312.1 hypothetical protein [bacterium]MBT6167603.1 hypothetical protein [Verrucomicrobiota bacterium]MBT7214058.1 hypothetical protein [Verrucomicrobiota bacterium]
MKPLLLILIFILPSCQEEKRRVRPTIQKEANTEDPNEKKKESLLNVPAGAVIEDLILPYYNDDQKKVSLLTIAEVTVADDIRTNKTILKGEHLKVWLFDEEGAIRSTTVISSADYLVNKEQLVAKSEVLMIGSNGKFAAKSKGGIFSLTTGQAILLGPATAQFKIPQKKDIKAP